MLKQLSIFAENKKGTMQQITQILFENDVQHFRFRSTMTAQSTALSAWSFPIRIKQSRRFRLPVT